MEEVIVFGRGKKFENVAKILINLGTYKIKEVWDNNASEGEKILYGDKNISVVKPYSNAILRY